MKPISRRSFLSGSLLAAATAPISTLPLQPSATAAFFSTDDIRLEEITITSPNLPQEFSDYRIGFLTDIHLGIYLPNEWIERSVKMLKHKGIDLLLIGGDNLWIPQDRTAKAFGEVRNSRFLSVAPSELPAKIYTELGGLLIELPAPDGMLNVRGNHDVWNDNLACQQQFEKFKIKTLINDQFLIQRDRAALRIIGVDDYWNGIPKLPRSPRSDDLREFRILISHNPDFVAQRITAEERSWQECPFDLALCGHTHGGQIKLPGIGALSYNVRHREFGEGLHITDRCAVYTSRGLGVVEVPYRINCPAEVSIITLKST